MSKGADGGAEPAIRSAKSWAMLGALVLGLALGLLAGSADGGFREPVLASAKLVGSLWLNALKMTVVPLIVALLVLGIAQGAEAIRAGRIAARTIAWFILFYLVSAAFGFLMITSLLGLYALPASAVHSLREALAGVDAGAAAANVPAFSDFFSGIIPSNAIAAASNGDILQLVIFTMLFAMAATRIGDESRRSLLGFFRGVRDALLVLIGWVLWIGPIGVFALAFALGMGAGAAAVAALVHYIVLLCIVGLGIGLLGYVIAVVASGRSLGAFAKAMVGPQSIAISTRSSLASLPAMLVAAGKLGVRERVADIVFPLIGALFRPTSPAMNLAVAVYAAHLLGIEPAPAQIVAAMVIAAVVAFGSVSLPGEITFIANIAPIAIILGTPVAPLAVLVAVEMIPDITRTLSNVTVDVAVAAAVDRSAGQDEA